MSYTVGGSTVSSSTYTFTDDCSEGLTYAVSVAGQGSLPSWLTHDASADVIKVQTTSNANVGVFTVSIVGTAASGVSATLSF